MLLSVTLKSKEHLLTTPTNMSRTFRINYLIDLWCLCKGEERFFRWFSLYSQAGTTHWTHPWIALMCTGENSLVSDTSIWENLRIHLSRPIPQFLHPWYIHLLILSQSTGKGVVTNRKFSPAASKLFLMKGTRVLADLRRANILLQARLIQYSKLRSRNGLYLSQHYCTCKEMKDQGECSGVTVGGEAQGLSWKPEKF